MSEYPKEHRDLLLAIYDKLPEGPEPFLTGEGVEKVSDAIMEAFDVLKAPEWGALTLGEKLAVFSSAMFARLTRDELGDTHPTSIAGCYIAEAMLSAYMLGCDDTEGEVDNEL